jgi:2-polyprenyl-3-methyl-5-hydroxy-6-metoxy-1,4-benzoquinol methylase
MEKAMLGPRLRKVIEGGLDLLNLKWVNELVRDSNKLFHAYAARRYGHLRGKKCLIVGCNRGRDCRYFVRFGAAEVHGVDIIKEIGKDYDHPKVSYSKTSCENMEGVPGEAYDLIYCFATMEHIPRIDLAFSEMVRVARPGGVIYVFSSPLWNSRYGHHHQHIFTEPWIHLRYEGDELIDHLTSLGIRDIAGGHTMKAIVGSIFSGKFFNRVPAKEYIDVCDRLRGIQIIKNELSLEEPGLLSPALKSELAHKGYNEKELLAVSHILVARKR